MSHDIDDHVRPILQEGNPTLRKVSQDVVNFDDSLILLINQMLATMGTNKGRGLAAIQIGMEQRVLVAYADNTLYVMVNPVITRTLNRNTIEMEGCLSVPRALWRNVSRPAKCEMRWQNVKGQTFTGGFEKESARVLQHEMDHLDGILIADKPFGIQ